MKTFAEFKEAMKDEAFRKEMALNDEGRVVCPFCKVEFASCVLYYNNGDSYDRVGCEQCGRHFRRYWEGDEWTQD